MSNTSRVGEIHRKTKETDIMLSLKLDGLGTTSIRTGVSFMDHMLTLFGVHGFFDLDIEGGGDIEVDDHHTVEDLGICLGQAFKSALGDLSSICRYGVSAIYTSMLLLKTRRLALLIPPLPKNFSGPWLCTQSLRCM